MHWHISAGVLWAALSTLTASADSPTYPPADLISWLVSTSSKLSSGLA